MDKMNQLLYTDDLRILATSHTHLKTLVDSVKKFSDGIMMNFGLNKCALAYFKKGRLEGMINMHLRDHHRIKSLESGETFRYLGVREGQGFNIYETEENPTKEYINRTRLILASDLVSKNKITAIGALCLLSNIALVDHRRNPKYRQKNTSSR